MITNTERDSFKDSLIDLLEDINGPLLCGDELRHLLGFETSSAMRSALSRELLPVILMEFPHRQGKFALSEEVASWLFEQRNKNSPNRNIERNPIVLESQLDSYYKKFGFLLHEEKIMKVLKINTRSELIMRHQKNALPFIVFRLDNRRTKMFALLLDVIPYLQGENS